MIKTRFAPSPTGDLHIGGLRTALYSYALAKKKGGKFILRIEDTDKKREIKGSKEKIKEILKTFGISWDEYCVQSERVDSGIYKKAAEKLVNNGYAYEDGGAIRIKIPKGEKITYHDFVVGKEITWDSDTLEDLVLLKSDGFPTYHLAVVVDDNDMGITHVLRGHDWMPSTPIHLLLYKYLGFEVPEIGHLTDILDPDGGKLSKRKGSTTCEGILGEGFIPEAMLNFVMLLGWAPKDNKELFTLDEFVKDFDVTGLQKANPIFNRDKLLWFNAQYLKQKDNSQITKELQKYLDGQYEDALIKQTIPLVKDRIKTYSEYWDIAGFFFEERKAKTGLFGSDYKKHLISTIEALENIKDWGKDEINKSLMYVVEKNKFKTGDFFMTLRIAITGSKFTPPINDSIYILGKEKTLKRLKKYV